MRAHGLVGLILGLALSACREAKPARRGEDPVFRPQILAGLPHDPEAFTQGLLIDGDFWLESTGQYGRSELREVRMSDGEVVRRVALSPRLFGEGLALWRGRLYQLTWRERTAIVYDRATFEERERFRYPGEGWGLTNNDEVLFMSDGSAEIRVLDPLTFREIRRFEVRGARGAVSQLNELEWIDGELWANIFQTNWIVRFSPKDGRVIGFVDLHHLPPPEDVHPGQDVLNGIAVDPATGDIWVTGKNWKALYRIERPE
jgi:glutamine cyclotransferase